MVDHKRIATALAGVTVTATVAFAVFITLTVNHYVGMWPAVTIAALIVAVSGTTILFAIGELDRTDGRQDRIR